MLQNSITDVSALRGLWRRTMIAWPDGSRDTTTSVRWLQGLRACIDLRQPAAGEDFSRVRCLNQLSIEHCTWLAKQQGFAGHCAFDGSHFEWVRAIDLQPKAPWADAGSLAWEGDVLIETGRDVAYVEHWQRDPLAPTLPVGAVTLRDIHENTLAALLRVGPAFMFARDRTVVASAYHTLGECIAAAPTLRQARELVDCEISFGDAQSAGFQIRASSLPYRIGDTLNPQFTRERLTTMDRAADGRPLLRQWEITGSEGNLNALQHAAAPSP